MPQKMSIEVVKHSDTDYRLIFKNGNKIIRTRFDSATKLLRYNLVQFQLSPIFSRVLFSFHICENETLPF